MKSILCVEDNAEIQILVEAALDEHRVVAVNSLAAAENQIARENFDLLILDLELPDGDGLKFLANFWKKISTTTPIFILTSKAETTNKVIAFSLGADDFISKPFDPLELRARVNGKLKKIEAAQEEKSILKVKDIVIDVPKQRVYLVKQSGQESISLTSLEFRLLMIFARSPDRVFSRAQLLDKVWGHDVSITDRTVDTHVGHLRKKIIDSKVKIDTVLNEGYRLVI